MLNKKGYICNLIFHKIYVFKYMQIKKKSFSVKTGEIGKYPKGAKRARLAGAQRGGLRGYAGQSLLYCH